MNKEKIQLIAENIKKEVILNKDDFLGKNINETLNNIKDFSKEIFMNEMILDSINISKIYERKDNKPNIEFDFNCDIPEVIKTNIFETYLLHGGEITSYIQEKNDNIRLTFLKIMGVSNSNILSKNKNYTKVSLLSEVLNNGKIDLNIERECSTDEDRRLGILIEDFKKNLKSKEAYYIDFIKRCNEL